MRVSRLVAGMPDVGSRDLARRVEAVRRQGVDVLPLMPYAQQAVSPDVAEAVAREIGRNHEAPSRGLPELCTAIAETLGSELSQAIDGQREVLITNGSMQALNLVFQATLNPGDEVIIPSPCYFFGGCVELAGGRPVYVPMSEKDEYSWDVDQIAAAVTPRTAAIVVSTPVNPTGVVLSAPTLEAIVNVAAKHDLLIVSDESYDTMVYDGLRHISIAQLPGARGRTLIIRSFTKSFAMPAWRVGYVVGPQLLIDGCIKVLEWHQLHGNHVAQAGATAAIRKPTSFRDRMAVVFQGMRDVVYPVVAATEPLCVGRPSGGPFLFVGVGAVFPSSAVASDAFLRVGVPTTPGHYCRSDRHVRLAFGAAPDVLREVGRRVDVAVRDALSGREIERAAP